MVTIEDGVRIAFDEDVDVLYARLVGSRIVDSRESDNDHELVFGLDDRGALVGVTIVGFRSLTPARWEVHSDRTTLPVELLNVIDRYIARGAQYLRFKENIQ